MFDRIKQWFAKDRDKPAPDPQTLARNTVEHDAFDRDDLNEILPNMGALRRASERLAEASPTGGQLLEDLVFSMLRARPKLADEDKVRPSHLPNRHIMAQAMDLPDWHRLHAETKGDPWYAGMAATAMSRTLGELLAKQQEQQEKAGELDDTLQELADADREQADLEKQLRSLDPTSEEAADLQETLDELSGRVDQLAGQAAADAGDLDRELTLGGLNVAAAMQQALNEAADKVSDDKATCAFWGSDPGQSGRMSADEHVRLAERLDSEKLRELARLWGAMRYDVQGARSQKSRYTRDEVYAIEQGNDLSRVLPSELVKLRHPLRKLEFWRGYTEGSLQQYELKGVEKQAQGGLYLLEDGSLSMRGQRELFAKATALHCMDIARQEERSFTGIMFCGPGESSVFRFEGPEDYTTDRMIEWAETFINAGGTCFQTPLTEALRMLTEEFDATGATTGDIVMVTDGEAAVDPDWYEHFKSEQKRLDFKVYGVQVGGGFGTYEYSLEALVDGPVSTVADLFSAKETRSVFAAI